MKISFAKFGAVQHIRHLQTWYGTFTTRIQTGCQSTAQPPNRNATNDKNVAKKPCLLQFRFLLASSCTTVTNNCIDNQEARAPLIQFLPTNLNALPG